MQVLSLQINRRAPLATRQDILIDIRNAARRFPRCFMLPTSVCTRENQ